MAILETSEYLSFKEQKQKITNSKDSDLDNYNLLDFELNDGFDMDFKEDDKKKKMI